MCAGAGGLPAGVAILPDVHTDSVLGLVQHLSDGNVTAKLYPVGLVDLDPLAAVFQDQDDHNGGNIALAAVVDSKLVNSGIASIVVAQIQIQVSSFACGSTEGEVGSQIVVNEVAQGLPGGSAVRPPAEISIALSSCCVAAACANNSTGQIDLLLFGLGSLAALAAVNIFPSNDTVGSAVCRNDNICSAGSNLDGIAAGNISSIAIPADVDVESGVDIAGQLQSAGLGSSEFCPTVGLDSDLVVSQAGVASAAGNFDGPSDPSKAVAKVLDGVSGAFGNSKGRSSAHTQVAVVNHNANRRLAGQSSSAGILSSPLVGSAAFQHKATTFCGCKCGRNHDCQHSNHYQSNNNFSHSVFLLKIYIRQFYLPSPCGKMCARDIHTSF